MLDLPAVWFFRKKSEEKSCCIRLPVVWLLRKNGGNELLHWKTFNSRIQEFKLDNFFFFGNIWQLNLYLSWTCLMFRVWLGRASNGNSYIPTTTTVLQTIQRLLTKPKVSSWASPSYWRDLCLFWKQLHCENSLLFVFYYSFLQNTCEYPSFELSVLPFLGVMFSHRVFMRKLIVLNYCLYLTIWTMYPLFVHKLQ